MNADDHTAQQTPEDGSFVMDASKGKVGQVMGHEGPCFQLRPLQGGREWEARPEDVRLATDAERLSAKAQAANSARRWWG
ncbi:hypothetical protein [Streptomyces roseoverticillatus]|uniref:hypothetical protein n=1 Tax=Streptomyces roseoverticillatus TaxID=66429 RepID=UPI0004C07472|nr:hypothetical protein [Streptomyces roseoverticillatus]